MMTNRRIRVLDNAPRPFKCTLCPQAFKQKGHLVQHLRIHTGTKPYRCELCGYASTIRGNLTAHTKLRHNNTNANKRTRLRCPHCGLYFKFIDTLQVHIASRHFGVVNAGRHNDNQTVPPTSTGFASPPQGAQNSYDGNVNTTTRPDVMPVAIATSAPTLSSDSIIFQSQAAAMMSVQQWEVIDNSSIAVRNGMMDAGAPSSSQSATDNPPVTQADQTSSTRFIADAGAPSNPDAVPEYDLTAPSGEVTDETGIKIEGQGFTDCQKEGNVSNSESSIGFSRTPMQQKLLYAAQSRTEKDTGTNRDDASSATDAGTRQDTLEISMDTGFVSSFDSSEVHNNQDVEEIRTVNSVISPNAVECIPSSSNSLTSSQLNMVAASSVKRFKKSKRSITSSSPVSVPRGNNLSMVSSPTMRSTLSPSSQQSINSPGINTTVHTFNQSAHSPSSPSSHAASPSRRSSLMKFKFQNKDSLLCEFCDIVFSDTIMHTIHMGWHNHQNPFQCGVCGKGCRDKYDFMCHFTRGHDST